MNQLTYSKTVARLTGLKTPQYRTVSTATIKGLREAERLHLSGWKVASQGLFTIQFYRAK